jgi:energy-coupling factor transporter ATP-binding protein EcfA2
MQRLERVHLVQFFLFPAQTLELDATTAIIAPNGAGKSALLDALQIVLLGADRSRIRFNAQAGGATRARTIRDYCLGVYRAGDDGRVRKTATTYISLVFRDEDSGQALTAGIALGASVDEPDHRLHGLYLLPGVALELGDHLERIDGKELPLEWSAFREQITRRCKQASTRPELHSASERFLKDLLLRLRPAPTAHLDPNAYRKAFQNALNLQRVDDVDLFVRTLVAEDRPTEVGRFRALLEGFRAIKEKIEQVARRIAAAEEVEQQYAKVAQQATRAASYRALAAEYERDLLGEQVDTAEREVGAAIEHVRSTQRALLQARSERASARDVLADATRRLQGTQGYGAQAGFDELAARDREQLAQLKKELMRHAALARDALQGAARLELDGLDANRVARAAEPWQALHAQLAALAADAALPLSPEAAHAQATQALAVAAPVLAAVKSHALERAAALTAARQRVRTARQNRERASEGKAELHGDVVRLMGYLNDEGIPAQPVCDLVRVADPAWQAAIEAYLGRNVEALLVPPADEERAVKLYRELRGSRSVYGIKLALSSQARHARTADAAADGVAALLQGENADALAFLRRQLGDLRRADTEAEVVRGRNVLTRDGLLAKGGSVERLHLRPASELKIGASHDRDRGRLLREELDAAEAALRAAEAEAARAEACQQALARLADGEEVAAALHERVLAHREAEERHRALREGHAASLDPDLLRFGEAERAAKEKVAALEAQVESLVGAQALAASRQAEAERLLEALRARQDEVARAAVAAFADADVDADRVERQREELDAKHPRLDERRVRCEERARESDRAFNHLLPDAWARLAQYAKDHALALEFTPEQWRPARALLARDLAHLRGTELVQYQAQADEAYRTSVDTFRANVAGALYDNFTRLRGQIATLNRTLRESPAFSNNERYRFHYEVAPEYRDLHRFVERAADLGGEDGLFGSAGELPPAFRDIIEESASLRGAANSPLEDYRHFFRFEVEVRQDERVIGTLSERMRSGSGGEHRAPLYVIAGAALAAAYGKSESQRGGLGLILLDEFGDKIDAQNARATTNYLRSLGLQLVLAAPDTAQGALTGVLDSYIELFRDGDLLTVERVEVSPQARELLQSDQFDLHPQLLDAEIARVERERADP